MVNAIELSDVSCRYRRQLALDHVTATLPAGRVTALVGPNGSGKSTLLAALAGVLPLAGGQIRNLPEDIAFVVQRSAVPDSLPITVRQTVEMGRWRRRGAWGRLRREDHQIVDEAMARLGLSELAGRQLGTLSGGQRQRALVAQGLAQRAALILLDEPLASVDVRASEYIAGAVQDARADGATIVIATHERDQARQADHVLHLSRGALLHEGPPGAAAGPSSATGAMTASRASGEHAGRRGPAGASR
ncbi:zinc ABC transporter ATP-binding protein AztA [Sediminivirga luteola]|uniref:ABC transporter ATPase n=1 Tax=Sediminivirga luteola TaxID=1774748 RepID=A0A8J2TVM0_9MICO|nr:ABC transporter ATPase [Sediminivirga luteola]